MYHKRCMTFSARCFGTDIMSYGNLCTSEKYFDDEHIVLLFWIIDNPCFVSAVIKCCGISSLITFLNTRDV